MRNKLCMDPGCAVSLCSQSSLSCTGPLPITRAKVMSWPYISFLERYKGSSNDGVRTTQRAVTAPIIAGFVLASFQKTLGVVVAFKVLLFLPSKYMFAAGPV